MDLQSLWLTNCRLLDQMNDSEFKQKETELIHSFFGGTKNMIQRILKNKDNLSFLEQKQLLQMLKKPLPSTKTNTNNTMDTTQNIVHRKNTKPIIHLNQDCLSNIFQFLQQDDRMSFSFTSRAICIASKNKSSRLNYQIMAFPLHKLYHFMHKMSAIKEDLNNNDAPMWIYAMQDVCSWISMQSQKKAYNICRIICKSGLLSIFSNLLINKQPLNQHIVHLLYLVAHFSRLHKYLINAHVIENLNLMMRNDNCASIQSKIIPHIIFILYNLFKNRTRFRIFRSNIIDSLIHILRNPKAMNYQKNVLWINRAAWLFRQWFEHHKRVECPSLSDHQTADIICTDLIPLFMHKIDSIIDVKCDRKWVYQLVNKGRVIRIGDSIGFSTNDSDDDINGSAFKVSDVVHISSQDDTNPTITLTGRLGGAEMRVGCDRKLTFPVSSIQCIYVGDTPMQPEKGVYEEIMEFLDSVCCLISAEQSCYGVHDLTSAQYRPIMLKIKEVIQLSQHQVFHYRRHNIFCSLLRIDCGFFMNLLSAEMYLEYHDRVRRDDDEEDVFKLMSVVWEAGKLECLKNVCSLEPIKRKLFGMNWDSVGWLLGPFPPKYWEQDMLIALIKVFYDDATSYRFLEEVIKGSGITTVNDESIIHCLVQILVNCVVSGPEVVAESTERDWLSKFTNILVVIFKDRFSESPTCTFLRKAMLNELKDMELIDDVVITAWWASLDYILIQNVNNESRVKCVLLEMHWLIERYPINIQNIMTDEFDENLRTLQTQHFEDDEIATILQSVLSLL
eukprot:239054_1